MGANLQFYHILIYTAAVILLWEMGLKCYWLYFKPRPRPHGIPKYDAPPPPPDCHFERSREGQRIRRKAHELIKGRVYTDPVAKVRVRVTKVAIEGSSSALESTARGMYWNTATQCYQSMEIADDQLEEYVTSAEPANTTGPASSTPDN